MTITDTPPPFLPTTESLDHLEEWESTVGGRKGIKRFDEKGNYVIDHVESGSMFYISPTERRRNQQGVRHKKNDGFTNGAFRLLRGVQGVTEIDPNDAPLTDAELEEILDLSFDNFRHRIATMSQPVTLDRMYRMARQAEVGKRKLGLITAKIKRHNPLQSLVGDVVGGAGDPANMDENEVKAKLRGPGDDIESEVEGLTGPRQYPNLEV